MAGESKGTRVIALVGPAGAGKTSLAEAMLFAAGASDRLGATANGSSIGDSSPESRQRGGSTELNLYHFDHLGDSFDPASVPPPAFDGSRETGFGVYLIASSVDDVRYSRDERGRNCVALTKVLGRERRRAALCN